MATSLESTIAAELGWTWRDHVESNPIVDSNHIFYDRDLLDGNGSGEANAVWHAENQTLSAGDSLTLELDLLVQSLFGDLVTIPLAKVKAILIVNKSTSSGGYLVVGGAATDPWHAPFGSSADTVKVMPDSPLLLAHVGAGWDVGLDNHALRIAAVGAAAVFDIAILGTLPETSSS